MKILFQGDSITDALRDRSNPKNLAGYTTYVAEELGNKNEYYNLGISGDLSWDVLARYDADASVVSPDVYTLLIGINDVWRRFTENRCTTPKQYADNVRELLNKVRSDCPGVKIVVIEPFLLPSKDKAHWRETLDELICALRELAAEQADGYVPMDGLFAKARVENKGVSYSDDGVHPNDLGNRVIAKYLAKEIRRVADL